MWRLFDAMSKKSIPLILPSIYILHQSETVYKYHISIY